MTTARKCMRAKSPMSPRSGGGGILCTDSSQVYRGGPGVTFRMTKHRHFRLKWIYEHGPFHSIQSRRVGMPFHRNQTRRLDIHFSASFARWGVGASSYIPESPPSPPPSIPSILRLSSSPFAPPSSSLLLSNSVLVSSSLWSSSGSLSNRISPSLTIGSVTHSPSSSSMACDSTRQGLSGTWNLSHLVSSRAKCACRHAYEAGTHRSIHTSCAWRRALP